MRPHYLHPGSTLGAPAYGSGPSFPQLALLGPSPITLQLSHTHWASLLGSPKHAWAGALHPRERPLCAGSILVLPVTRPVENRVTFIR